MGGDTKEGGQGCGPRGLPSIAENDTFLKRFRLIEKIGEGSYSEVIKCKNVETGTFVACKRLRHVYKSWNQVNDIPEVTTLRTLARHPQILQMLEIHYDVKQGKVSLVFEIMDMNLYEFIKDRKRLLPESTVRLFMYQLLKALRHLHKYGVFHRDIKPENILIRLKSNVLKLGDLGSVRGVYSQPPFTEYISTRWYRSPECLLTAGQYGFKMDIWAAGCVFYEILTLQPLFPGSSEIDQINRIHSIMGPPSHKTLQKFSKFKSKAFDWNNNSTGKEIGLDRKLPAFLTAGARDLVKQMLTYDPDGRPTSQRVMNHPYFNDVRDFKVPESEIVKTPIIAVCGDELGRIMISQYYGHLDLKTLGDKKPQKRIKMQFSTPQKQQASTTVKKSSSPILRGGLSPETPKGQRDKAVLNASDINKKPTNPNIRSRTLKPNLPTRDSKNKLHVTSNQGDSPHKKTVITTDKSVIGVPSGNKNQDAVIENKSPNNKPKIVRQMVETISSSKPSPPPPAAAMPSLRYNLTMMDKNNNNSVVTKRPNVTHKYAGAAIYRSEKISTNIAKETRMALIAQSLENVRQKAKNVENNNSNNYAAKAAKRLGLSYPQTSTDCNNNKLLQQQLPSKYADPLAEKNSGARIVKEIRNLHILEKTNDAAKVAAVGQVELSSPLLKISLRDSDDMDSGARVCNRIAPLHSKFKGENPSAPIENTTNTSIEKVTRIAQILENRHHKTRRFESDASLQIKTLGIYNEPEERDSTLSSIEIKKPINPIIKPYTLKLRSNQENNKHKLIETNSTPQESSSPPSKNGRTDKHNGGATSFVSKNQSLEDPMQYEKHDIATSTKLDNIKMRSIAPDLGNRTQESSLPSTMAKDWNFNVVTTTKPPLPPKYTGVVAYRSELSEQAPATTSVTKEARIAQILENAVQNQNSRRTTKPALLEPKTFGVFIEPAALKRRTERIRAQLRDEVYCSSDDDIVSTMRQKLDILISERARRARGSSHNSPNNNGDEEGQNFESKPKNLRPRKLLKKETLNTAEGDAGGKSMHSLSVGDVKKGRQPFSNYNNNQL
ncbi:serine/threonine-protein kinase BUR1 isoform X2 [Folsomia candida]|uniref:serine/threonine-protein kinase BUR1 isoform X2 n=1 Tax=Folsomia candida TaxID=158441 RepID=UPI0016050BC9|nr:serine/threonine-protein kinase BUR1 isoform X2 [Folsomia candida]